MDERRRLAAGAFEIDPAAIPIGIEREASGRRAAPPAKARPRDDEPSELLARGSNLKFGRGRLLGSYFELESTPDAALVLPEKRSS
eukprot:scaffold16900_cov105-Isochrysis_galbana.AAC.6